MAHWEHRPEERWQQFRFGQPYAKGLRRLREEVLGRHDFDPAVLWQWGTMQAMALIEVLHDAEVRYGAEGQRLVAGALRKTGLDVGRQILAGATLPEGLTEAELASFYATVINRIAYASLEAPRIDDAGRVSFEILWCPHQDHYAPFDCRVQRYLVEGMLEALGELGRLEGWTVRFDSTMPAGAPSCRFTIWRASAEERDGWQRTTAAIEEKALERARRHQD